MTDLTPRRWGPAPPTRPDWTRLFRDLEGEVGREPRVVEQLVRWVVATGELRPRLVEAGDLPLPSPDLLLGDVLTSGADLASVPVRPAPGAYPVYLAVWDHPASGPRTVAALLVLSAETPTRWEKVGAFIADSGVAAFGARPVVERFDEREQGEAVAARWSRREGESLRFTVRRASKQRPAETLLFFTSGYGDGVYGTYVGRCDEGRAVAVVAGFGVLAGDEAEVAEVPPTPSALRAARLVVLGRFLRGFEPAPRRDLAGLGELLALDAELRGPDAEVVARGPAEVITALAEALPDVPLAFDHNALVHTPPDDEGAQEVAVAAYPRVSHPLGSLRVWLPAGRITRVQLLEPLRDPSAVDAPPAPSPGATDLDRELVERAARLEGLSPLKRALVEDLLRAVRSGQVLTEGQRSRARSLLGEEGS